MENNVIVLADLLGDQKMDLLFHRLEKQVTGLDALAVKNDPFGVEILDQFGNARAQNSSFPVKNRLDVGISGRAASMACSYFNWSDPDSGSQPPG